VPLNVCYPADGADEEPKPAFVGFYRWHLLDPVMFAKDLRVTIQQLGYATFYKGQEAEFTAYKENHAVTPTGWLTGEREWFYVPQLLAMGVVERSDDYCATAFVYCREPQPVPRLDVAAANRDIARLPFEEKRK